MPLPREISPFLRACGLACALLLAPAARAAGAHPGSTRAFAIPAGSAADTLNAFSRQAGVEIIFPGNAIRGVDTRAVNGSFTPAEALARMLGGTDLRMQFDEQTGAYAVSRVAPEARSRAPAPAPGVIEGRVSRPGTGEYLERVHLSVDGTSVEGFTDDNGFYRLAGVPPGKRRVRLFFTGLRPLVADVNVAPGAVLRQDFALALREERAHPGELLRLAPVVVSAERQMSAAARAINEQRFAPNVKDVVATDEFGDVAEGNVAEFMKFLPGVNIDFAGGNARDVSLNGVSGEYVPITMDGFSLASAVADGAGGTSRGIALDQVSLNNLSRVEVEFSPTPESQGSALAGSVNLVARSSFERSQPMLSFSTYLLMRDNAREWRRTPGPLHPSRKIHPGADFSYLAPVNSRLGFTVSAGTSRQYSDVPQSENSWRGSRLPTNGTTFPDTTADRPYLTAFNFSNGANDTTRSSVGTTLDYRPGADDRLSLSFQASTFDVLLNRSELRFNVGAVAPGAFTTASTHGTLGAGLVQLATTTSARTNWTYMPSLLWRHAGPRWKLEGGFAYSRARNRQDDLSSGFFAGTLTSRRGVTVWFDDVAGQRPGRVTVLDPTGTAVDPYHLGGYSIDSGSGNQRQTDDTRRTLLASVRRDFPGALPFSLKAGCDLRDQVRDVRTAAETLAFLGADRSAARFLDESFSRRAGPFGFPSFEGISAEKLHAYFRAHPQEFSRDDLAAYRSRVNDSKHAEELISAGYLRVDLQALHQRLKVVTGIRFEQTHIRAEGPLSDPTRNVLRDADGSRVLSGGRPQPATTDPLQALQLTLLDRGAHAAKDYTNAFPSLNLSYDVTQDLVARVAYATSIGRPNFNQYAGGLTLPDPDNPTPDDRIVVSNVGVRPWRARAVQVRLEYYLAPVGLFSVSVFRRDFQDFFGAATIAPTPDFLSPYGLDQATYGRYPVVTQFNIDGTVRMQGVALNYRQALTLLPHWARGVQVFANFTDQRLLGPSATDFPSFVRRTANWGASFSRDRFSVRANWNWRDRRRRNAITSPTIESGTFTWWPQRIYVDLNAEYSVTRHLAVFALLRNISDTTNDVEDAGPSTPPTARFRSRAEYGSLWMFGMKGRF